MRGKSTLRLPHAIPGAHPFRIQSSDACEMGAFYSLDPVSNKPQGYLPMRVSIQIKREGKKPMVVATATFFPHKDRCARDPHSVLKYAVTQKGIREIAREHINKHHVGWVSPVKKAVEKCVREFFTLKDTHRKLDKKYTKRGK